jgi:RHS repeat-associated protein
MPGVYQWDGTRLAGRTNATGSTLGDYQHAYGWAISSREGLIRSTLHTDVHGTPQLITDGTGAIAGWTRTDVWGVEKASTGQQSRLGHTGYLKDPLLTDELYAQARQYRAGVGRFTSRDEWAGDFNNPVSLNPYLYGFGNPGSYIDPNGRAGWATSVRDFFNDNDDHYARQLASEETGWFGNLGNGALRTFNAIGSAPFRAANAITDVAAAAAPGEVFSGVREEGQRETTGNALMAWDATGSAANAALHPADTAVSAHGATVGFVVDLASGEKAAAATLGGLIAGAMTGPLANRFSVFGSRTTTARTIAEVPDGSLKTKPTTSGQQHVMDSDAGERPPGMPDCCERCFGAGTLVMTADGLKPIEQVKVGEQVIARDEATGKTGLQTVQHVFVRSDRKVFDLTFKDDAGNEELIAVTADHRFHTSERGWVVSAELQFGETIDSLDGRKLTLAARSTQSRNAPTYNLSVAEDPNYFVGRSGLWVHNCAQCGNSTHIPAADDKRVYAHYDADGNVNYYGISTDTDIRARQHRADKEKTGSIMRVISDLMSHGDARTIEAKLIRARIDEALAKGIIDGTELIAEQLRKAGLLNKNRGREQARWTKAKPADRLKETGVEYNIETPKKD